MRRMGTLAELQQAYEENADYDEVGSVAKAKAFRTACRRLIAKLPSSASQDSVGTIQNDLNQYKEALNAANRWLASNDTSATTTGGVKFSSFERFRG